MTEVIELAGPSGQTPLLHLPYPTPDDSVDVPRDIQALASAVETQGAFIVGEVRFIAITATPAGWVPADGAARSRTTYAALFAAIGVTFGAGDGSTTFNVPDLRGRVPVGAGQGAGLSNRVVGTKWGVEAIVLTTAQMPSHAHGVSDPGHAHLFDRPGARTATYGNDPDHATYVGAYYGTQSAATGISIQANGGGAAHDNTQPSLAVPAYIYAGV